VPRHPLSNGCARVLKATNYNQYNDLMCLEDGGLSGRDGKILSSVETTITGERVGVTILW
jgi:hypothetical protein